MVTKGLFPVFFRDEVQHIVIFGGIMTGGAGFYIFRSLAFCCAHDIAARTIQIERCQSMGLENIRCNAEVDGEALEQVAVPDNAGQEILSRAIDVMKLTARGYHRVLRVARTLADLEGGGEIGKIHISEALSYRQRRHMR